MKHFLSCLFVFCALLSFTERAAAQNLSNSGTDFWVGYGHHQFMEPGQPNSQEMILYLSAEQTANVTVRIEGTPWVRNYTVAAGTVIASDLIPKTGANDARLISLPCSFVPPGTPCGGEGVFVNKGIHITSDAPIVAYAHIYGSASSGATMLMPVSTWGYSYMTLNSRQNYAANCFSWSYVIAQHDNTVIEVTPSQVTRFGRPAGTPYTITLNRGEIYQFMAGPEGGGSKPELSGSKIRSIGNTSGQCYPIAVFAGSSRTSNPIVCGSGGGDNDNQQIFPSQAWGKRYLTAPTSVSGNASTFMMNAFKIAVKDPTTVVKRNGVQIPFASLQNGAYYYFESNTADFIEADKPIMVAQFMSGGACMGGAPNVGDPEMMYISPVEQGIKRIGFYRNNRESITTNYLTLIIPTAGVASLLIDGSSTFSYTYPHPNLPGYTVVVRRWSSAQAQATAQSDSAFTAITYGLGSVESYGYNAGTLINNLNVLPAIHNVNDTTVAVHDYTCTVTPVELGCNIAYKPTNLVWKLSSLGAILTPNADVIDNNPIPVDSSIIFGRWYYKFVCPGTYVFNDTGNYEIPVLSTHPSIENCTNTEEVKFNVRVKRSPLAEFSFSHTGCVADTIELTGVTTSAGYVINQWQWSFPTISETDTGIVSRQLFLVGSNVVNLRVISQEGCVRDTSGLITIYDKPQAGFFTSAPGGCEGTNIVFTDTSSYDGSAPLNNVYWDFGDGTILNTVNANPVNHTYNSYGVYTVRHAVGVSGSCVSDTISRQITISAKPTTSFIYPAGCLPATGVVQFNSTATTPDGQTITNHLWTFGDPPSGPANTSVLANPSHTYPGFGSYTITYRTTTNNGCFKDTTVNATFNLAPAFNYPALANVCQNNAGTVNVATATVTNAVPGAGVYNGPGTTPAGQFDPAAAGAGTHTIWYVYTATSGCKDSVSQTITVNPTPNASFSIAGAGCLPSTGTVSFTYTGTAQPGQTYSWNFGDPASGVNNTSTLQNPTHNYTSGSYTISLVVTNPATGCSNTQTITQAFNVTPALSYPALPPTCENLNSVNIATATVTNGVAGSGIYSGPGTSAAGIFNPSVAGPGTHSITYTFTSAGNCVSSITQTILVNPKPAASFTYPTGCLPENGIASFTYNGSVTAGQTYLWNFGDPASGANNTSTAQNPTHTYTNTGVYSVSVTVTNPNGCVDDSVINNITFSVTPLLNPAGSSSVCLNNGPLTIAPQQPTNGVTGSGVFTGPGITAGGVFTPALAGVGSHTITYTFTSTGNCVASNTRTIVVRPVPAASFTASTAACLPANGNVQFTYTGAVQPGQTYSWDFGDPASGVNNTSTLQNPSHNFPEGPFRIILTVSANGCAGKDTLDQTFALTPALNFPALPPTCENLSSVNIATATVTNGVAGMGVYSGPGTSAAGIFNPSVAGAGTHTITYTFTSGANCAATVTQTILVNPKPNASFTYPTAACLPATGIANFTYNGSMSAGQTYSWNFGDPASGANNTSTLQNPTHTYTNTGTYNVIVTVTNANGCVDDSVINNIVFSVTPALTYPALAPVCENLNAVNIATAAVTNGVTGNGVYSGPGTSAAGIFNPTAAGAGTHTITYTFTSSGNCVSTITQTILVNPKPVAAFTITPNICLGQQANISSNASIPSGSISTWKWFFGDGNTATYSNGNNFSYSYAAFGTYTVKLVTVSANGCESDTARQTITVGTVPVAGFTMPSSVCMPGAVSFTNTSTVSDGSALTYAWNFGEPASGANNTSTAINPSHTYAGSGAYTVSLRATGGNGCFKDTVQVFDRFYDKPIARFSVNPTELCQGSDNVFTDQSSAPNSTISSRLWIFGDGTTSTAANPTKRYNSPNSYVVKLVVTNAQGCVSDTFRQTVIVHLQPVIDAGPSFVVPAGSVIQFQGTGNDNSGATAYLWTPSAGLSNPASLTPQLTALADQTYTLTATGAGNCTATDVMTVKILRPLKIPNAFSPNGDGINDTWIIENLADYPGAIVEVYNRYGQLVMKSTGYSRAWDGTSNGKPLPLATYYYIIQLKNGFKPLNGSITIIK